MSKVIDPMVFKDTFWPDVTFYDEQKDIVYSVLDNDETVCVAGNMLGKDFVSAFIVLWFFLSRTPCRVVTTSADFAQLEDVLWGEMRRFIQNSKYPLEAEKGGPLLINHMKLRKVLNPGEPGKQKLCGLSYVEARVAKKGEGLLGHHIADVGDGVPRTLLVVDEACHDDRTEILTDSGWKFFSDLTGSEKFLTMDPLTRLAHYARATHVHRARRKGKMLLYRRRCGDFCVTPNHRMLWKRRRSHCKEPWSGYYLEPLDNLNGTQRSIPRRFTWIGDNPATTTLPHFGSERKVYHSREVPTRDFVEFLGWYMSEGNLFFSSGIPYGVCITQKDVSVLERIKGLCSRMGFNPRIILSGPSPCLRINERRLAEYLLSFGRYCHEKRVPDFIGTLCPELIEVFLRAYTDGDGYRRSGGRDVIYTSSEKMADDLQILSYKAGREATVTKRSLIGLPAPNGFSRRDGFVVSRSRGGLDSHLKLKRQYLEEVDYDGEVFCVTVPPFGTIFTRRNGVCMWGGNSGAEEEVYERTSTWARRMLIIGNPFPTSNFFYRFVKGGDVPRKPKPGRKK